MAHRNRICLLLMLFCATVNMQAQSADNGKKVKRIVFDREQVTVIYSDGDRKEVTKDVTVKGADVATSVKGVGRSDQTSASNEMFDLQGRKLTTAPQRKGVYLKREGKQIRKIVKK